MDLLYWTSSDETIARVDKSGKVRGIKEGSVVITARLGSISSSVDLVVRESSERFIELTYIRNNNDYDGWNLWIWNSALSNGRVDFQEVSSEGAVVRFPINQKSENVGFILRKAIGDNEWGQKDIVEDRFIETHFTQQITKLIVRQGQKEIEIIPAGTVTSMFTDVGKEHWAYNEIQNLASRGVRPR